jgi:RNA polymerase sigma-70 factor (ECF subfamily)
MTPERLYEKHWAITLLDDVLRRLREEFIRAGKLEQFDLLKVFLAGRSAEASYAEVAKQLGVSDGAAMAAASRLRRRYRELLCFQVAQTLADPEELADEMRALFQHVARWH